MTTFPSDLMSSRRERKIARANARMEHLKNKADAALRNAERAQELLGGLSADSNREIHLLRNEVEELQMQVEMLLADRNTLSIPIKPGSLNQHTMTMNVPLNWVLSHYNTQSIQDGDCTLTLTLERE